MIRKGRRGRSKRSISVGRQAAVATEPVVAAPELLMATPEPVVAVPEGAVATPEPVVAALEGAVATPEPVVAALEPAVVEPGAAASPPVVPPVTEATASEPTVVAEPHVPVSLLVEPPAILQTDTPVAFDRPGDEASFPPVDLDSHFFEGHTPSRPPEPVLETEERDPRMALKLTPQVARRRADLAKYVKLAVAGASVLCLAALVKVAVARGQTDEGVRRPTVTAAAGQQAPKEALAPTDPPAPAEPQAVADPSPPPPPAEPQALAPAETQAVADPPPPAPTESAPAVAPAAETGSVAPPAGDTPELDPKAAAKEKNTSRAALERGKVTDAIEAGERSVALDPTDGEAWLILGASYQQKGDMKNARRSYKACLDQGKRGPKYECAAMPH